MAATLFTFSTQASAATKPIACAIAKPPVSSALGSSFMEAPLRRISPRSNQSIKICRKVMAQAAVGTAPMEQIDEITLPSWAMFELGREPVYWKTLNGLPPAAGEKLKLFYNPAAKKLVPNDNYGIAFNGGFNQPIMCGGEPRAMLMKVRGKADPPIYSIQICIPKHAVNLIFSFTNGVDWDGPYRLQFQVPKAWRNRPLEFFNEGLAEELSKEGACDRAIFPDTNIVVDRCAMVNLSIEGGDRCDLNFVSGCMDPGSLEYNPLANVDDGSCPIDSDLED